MTARVFVVEDEALIAMEIEDQLSRLGYVLCGHAARAAQAVERILATDPDLLLVDVNLGRGATGFDVVTQTRARGCRAAVIFLTAYSGAELVAPADLANTATFMLKPFSASALEETVRAVLGPRVLSSEQ